MSLPLGVTWSFITSRIGPINVRVCVHVGVHVCVHVAVCVYSPMTLGFGMGVDLHLDLNGIEDLKVIGQICRLCNCQYKKLPRFKVMGVRARSIDHGHRSESQGENKRNIAPLASRWGTKLPKQL